MPAPPKTDDPEPASSEQVEAEIAALLDRSAAPRRMRRRAGEVKREIVALAPDEVKAAEAEVEPAPDAGAPRT